MREQLGGDSTESERGDDCKKRGKEGGRARLGGGGRRESDSVLQEKKKRDSERAKEGERVGEADIKG